MSVMMTSTCMPFSKARYSAAVRAMRGGGDALHRRVVGQVCEEHRPVDGAGAAELLYEEVGLLEGDADGGKDHGEVARVVPQHTGLPGDLGGQGRVGQAGAEKMGSFWPRTRVFRPSMVEMPVWINSLG